MEVVIKPPRARYIVLLTSIILVFFVANKVYLHLFPQEPTISALYGEIEIYVGGVWVPAKAGMNIQGAKIRIKEGGALALGDKIIKAEKDTEFQIIENQVKIEEGNIVIEERKKTVTEKSQETESKYTEKKPEKIVIEEAEKTTTEKPQEIESKYTEKKPEKSESRRIINVSIENALSSEGQKILNSKYAIIKVETENINTLEINGIIYNSDIGNFEISLPLKEGDNHIEIIGLDKNRRVIDRKVETVHVDTTPPTLNKSKIKIRWE